eukprot:scaffold90085_cov36-Phaeocystis_antarctica.AAC.2
MARFTIAGRSRSQGTLFCCAVGGTPSGKCSAASFSMYLVCLSSMKLSPRVNSTPSRSVSSPSSSTFHLDSRAEMKERYRECSSSCEWTTARSST